MVDLFGHTAAGTEGEEVVVATMQDQQRWAQRDRFVVPVCAVQELLFGKLSAATGVVQVGEPVAR